MSSFLIRTLKSRLANGEFQNNTRPWLVVTTGERFKDYWANEYLIELDERRGDVISFVVNCIAMAERQLMLDGFIYCIALYDLSFEQGVNGAPSKLLYPRRNTSWRADAYDFGDASLPVTRKLLNLYNNTVSDEVLFQHPVSYGNPFDMTKEFQGASVYPERALVLARNTNFGPPQKQVYFNCVRDSDIEITREGKIAIRPDSELLLTRLNLFNHYMRWANAFVGNRQLDANGIPQPGRYPYGPFRAVAVSDMKKARRRHDVKSKAAKRFRGEIARYVQELEPIFAYLSFPGSGESLNLDVLRSIPFPLSEIHAYLKRLLRFLLSRFPYIKNNVPVDKALYEGIVYERKNFLIPNADYVDFQTVFFILEGYWLFFDSCLYKYQVATLITRFRHQNINWYNFTNYVNFYRDEGFYPTSFEQVHDVAVRRMAEIKRISPMWKSALLDMGTMVGRLERICDVRGYDSSFNTDLPNRVLAVEENGRLKSLRVAGESGISHPKPFKIEPLTPSRLQPGQSYEEVAPVYPRNGKSDWWQFTGADFQQIPIIGGEIPFYYNSLTGNSGVDQPAPVAKKQNVWDNTIHPLTAEEEDAEAISLLEEIEENERSVGHFIWEKALFVLEKKGKKVPPVIAGIGDVLIDVAIEEINPTDRTNIEIPNTHITVHTDGSIPTTYDGLTATFDAEEFAKEQLKSRGKKLVKAFVKKQTSLPNLPPVPPPPP